jgi:hypothetical protein
MLLDLRVSAWIVVRIPIAGELHQIVEAGYGDARGGEALKERRVAALVSDVGL